MRATLFWVLMRLIGPVFLDFWALKIGRLGYPETSVRNSIVKQTRRTSVSNLFYLE